MSGDFAKVELDGEQVTTPFKTIERICNARTDSESRKTERLIKKKNLDIDKVEYTAKMVGLSVYETALAMESA